MMRSVSGVRLGPGVSANQRIISNNFYAHDEQGVNPGHIRRFGSVLYKLWPLLLPWLAASRYQPRWRENRARIGSTADWPWCTRSQMDWLKFHRSTILYHVRRIQQEVILYNSSVSNLLLTHLSMRFSSDHSSLECSSTSSSGGGLAWYIQATYEPTSAVLTICILHGTERLRPFRQTPCLHK